MKLLGPVLAFSVALIAFIFSSELNIATCAPPLLLAALLGACALPEDLITVLLTGYCLLRGTGQREQEKADTSLSRPKDCAITRVNGKCQVCPTVLRHCCHSACAV